MNIRNFPAGSIRPPVEGYTDETCPYCGDTGYEPFGTDRRVRCRCRENEDYAENARRAQELIPPRWRNRTRESWAQKFGPWPRTAPPAGEVWTDRAWSVTILGAVGTGKTSMASILFVEALTSGRFHVPSCAWLSTQYALEKVRREFGAPDQRTRRQLYDASVLLLDDLGAERGTEFELDLIRGAISHRYAHQLPTIVTSNAASAAALDAIDPRVSSRLCEAGETFTVVLRGEDRRISG